jgi:hypothetical protein
VAARFVVVDAPRFDSRLRVRRADKPVLVQTFITAFAVEAVNVGVLDRLARSKRRSRGKPIASRKRWSKEFRPFIMSENQRHMA